MKSIINKSEYSTLKKIKNIFLILLRYLNSYLFRGILILNSQ